MIQTAAAGSKFGGEATSAAEQAPPPPPARHTPLSPQIISQPLKHIHLRLPNVTLSLAIEVFALRQIARLHELRLAHRTRPRAAHLRELDIAAIENLERAEKLFAEK